MINCYFKIITVLTQLKVFSRALDTSYDHSQSLLSFSTSRLMLFEKYVTFHSYRLI